MANWDKLKSLVNQMNDELYSENVVTTADVDLKETKRFIEQYRAELNADIIGEKDLLEMYKSRGLSINVIEQEGFVRGLMYALNNFEYYFPKND